MERSHLIDQLFMNGDGGWSFGQRGADVYKQQT